MTDHLCPDDIAMLWSNPEQRVRGALKLLEWFDTLALGNQDRVWLRDVGWLTTDMIAAFRAAAGQFRDESADASSASNERV